MNDQRMILSTTSIDLDGSMAVSPGAAARPSAPVASGRGATVIADGTRGPCGGSSRKLPFAGGGVVPRQRQSAAARPSAPVASGRAATVIADGTRGPCDGEADGGRCAATAAVIAGNVPLQADKRCAVQPAADVCRRSPWCVGLSGARRPCVFKESTGGAFSCLRRGRTVNQQKTASMPFAWWQGQGRGE